MATGMALVEDPLTGQMRLVTSVTRGDTSKETLGPKGMVIIVTHIRYQITNLPEWFTKTPVVSDTEYLASYTMTCNRKKYKWFTS